MSELLIVTAVAGAVGVVGYLLESRRERGDHTRLAVLEARCELLFAEHERRLDALEEGDAVHEDNAPEPEADTKPSKSARAPCKTTRRSR